MILWLDAQFPPRLTRWLHQNLGIEAHALRDLDLRGASDSTIFQLALDAGAVLLTKDRDFVELLNQKKAGPPVILLREANLSNPELKAALLIHWAEIRSPLAAGERLVVVEFCQ